MKTATKVLIVAAMLASRALASETYTIDTYEFAWTAAESGDAKMVIETTEDATKLRLWQDTDQISMSPASAEKIGIALRQTARQYAAMRGNKKDESETVKLGEHSITFRQHPEYGFSAVIAGDGLMLDRIISQPKTGRGTGCTTERCRANGGLSRKGYGTHSRVGR